MRVGFGRGRRATLKRNRFTVNPSERQKLVFELYRFMHVGMRVCM
jgi:hypothetical protein